MFTVILLVALLIALDIAALRWGFPSNDGPESAEWERRQRSNWPETHTTVRDPDPLRKQARVDWQNGTVRRHAA